MKYSLALISLFAAMASAAPIEELATRSSINHMRQGTPFCAGRDHCVYLHKHAFTYLIDPKSPGSQKDVICESYDNNGHGRGACQFPNKVATTIQCDYTGDIAYVDFKCHHSSIKFHKQTKMTAQWSSEKSQGIAPKTTDSETTEVGDDLYIRCHAGRHHHQHHDDSNGSSSSSSSSDNYGHSSGGSGSSNGGGSFQAYGTGSASASGSISGSGHIGGSKENYNQGLPSVGY